MKKAIIIQGPTATGKTALAVQLAVRLGTEIVSADSRQCYEGMCIGTAWPTVEELQAVKHYFIGEFPVTQNLTAADYETLALQYLHQIFAKQDTAIVCGGTGLYIKALCEGLDAMPQVDAAIGDEVNDLYAAHGLAWLQAAVQAEDPAFFASGEIHNPARLLRALVFVRSVGQSILLYRNGVKKQRDFSIIKIGLELPRETLYDRCNKRVDAMMAQGLLREVTGLFPQRHLKNLQTVGYTELFDYLEGKHTLPEAIEKIKQHTRNYAKRQLTWFRKDQEMVWLDAAADGALEQILGMVG